MLAKRLRDSGTGLLLIAVIGIVHLCTVIDCQFTSRRNQSSGINKNSEVKLKKEKSVTKVKKDIESETQRAIEEIDTELTTLAIDHQRSQNQTNSTSVQSDVSLTSNQTSIINETDVTTPLFASNMTSNEANETTTETSETTTMLETTTGEALERSNSTQYESDIIPTLSDEHNLTDEAIPPNVVHNMSDPTQPPLLETTLSETPTEMSEPLNRSPVRSSTTSPIDSYIGRKTNADVTEELIQCVFETPIECEQFKLKCFGSGEVDCGRRTKRYAQNMTSDVIGDDMDITIFKSLMEKQSYSETIDNSRCVMTPFEGMDFACVPIPLLSDCNGRSVCRLIEGSADETEGIPFWKVALIATLTAIGAICFIIVAIIAYVSYRKLKVSPDSSLNGSNRSQDVTRV